jgi:CheY-like chemotaxis protein
MADLSRRRILVVEDEAVIALDLAKLLRSQGATVVGPAASPNEALAQIARTRIDCAVLDVKLAAGDCGPVAQALTWSAVPFAFVTGHLRSELVSRFSWMLVVPKPHTATDIIDRLKSVLT